MPKQLFSSDAWMTLASSCLAMLLKAFQLKRMIILRRRTDRDNCTWKSPVRGLITLAEPTINCYVNTTNVIRLYISSTPSKPAIVLFTRRSSQLPYNRPGRIDC